MTGAENVVWDACRCSHLHSFAVEIKRNEETSFVVKAGPGVFVYPSGHVAQRP